MRSGLIGAVSKTALKSGTSHNFKCWPDITAVIGAVIGDRELYAPAMDAEHNMTDIPGRYRLKALACEEFSREATDRATRDAWIELAIEWHALAHQIAQKPGSVLNYH